VEHPKGGRTEEREKKKLKECDIKNGRILERKGERKNRLSFFGAKERGAKGKRAPVLSERERSKKKVKTRFLTDNAKSGEREKDLLRRQRKLGPRKEKNPEPRFTTKKVGRTREGEK